MRLRSLLFVPGDRPDRFQKALSSGADGVIIDLEDSVAPSRKEKARTEAQAFLGRHIPGKPVFIRVNPLMSPECERDLAAVASMNPAGIVLPKSEGAGSVEHLAARLRQAGSVHIPILPIATETPAAIFGLGSYAQVTHLILGLTWGAEDLPAAIGATTSREPDGRYTGPYEVVRSLALFAAHAASVQAIETVYPNLRDIEGLKAYAARGRRDGFTGMMAIHPDQIGPINAAFTPTAEDIAWAKRVVSAFDADPDAGVVQLDGRMLDRPHLAMALATVAAGCLKWE